MADIRIFHNNKFGSVRTTVIDNEPWFVGKDVAEKLGYTNPRKAIIDHVDADDKGVTKCDTLGGTQELTVINESGLYSLVLSSKLPTAKAFKKWVTSEILPTIRKTGGYVDNDDLFLNTYLPTADDATRGLFKATLVTMRKQTEMLEAQKREIAEKSSVIGKQQEVIAEQKPKADYFDNFMKREGLSNIRDTATQLHIPQNLFVRLLIEQGFLYRTGEQFKNGKTYHGGQLRPAANKNNGYFKLKDFVAPNGYVDKQVFVTAKGKSFFHEYFADIVEAEGL